MPALGVSGVYLIFGAATVGAVAVAAIVCRPLVLVELDATSMPGEVAPVVTGRAPRAPADPATRLAATGRSAGLPQGEIQRPSRTSSRKPIRRYTPRPISDAARLACR